MYLRFGCVSWNAVAFEICEPAYLFPKNDKWKNPPALTSSHGAFRHENVTRPYTGLVAKHMWPKTTCRLVLGNVVLLEWWRRRFDKQLIHPMSAPLLPGGNYARNLKNDLLCRASNFRATITHPKKITKLLERSLGFLDSNPILPIQLQKIVTVHKSFWGPDVVVLLVLLKWCSKKLADNRSDQDWRRENKSGSWLPHDGRSPCKSLVRGKCDHILYVYLGHGS